MHGFLGLNMHKVYAREHRWATYQSHPTGNRLPVQTCTTEIHTAHWTVQVDTDSETGSECETRVLKLVQSACGASEARCPSPAWVALSILAGD